ncbi:MAG: PAS domain S-box protein [Desulfurivibrionaceae bacterium]|jgi:PAS domain S-box-containing protein
MDGKPTYAELEQRVRELEDRCALLSAGMDSFFVEAPAGLGLFDRELRYVRINKTLADFAGKSVADHLGRQLHEMVPGDVGLKAEEGLRRVLATGEAVLNQEISGEMPEQPGIVRHWLHSQFPVPDSTGEIVGLGVVVVEITPLKRLFEETRKKEIFQRLLHENLPEKIFMKDALSRFLYCNKNLAQDMGIAPDEIAGKSDFDFFPRDLAEKYRADDMRILSSGKTEELEERYLANGKEYVVRTVKAPVISEQGKAIGLLGIAHDITDRKQAETALAQYQAGLEKLIGARTAELQETQKALRKACADQEKKIAEQTRELEEKVAELVQAIENQKVTEVELRESEERFRQIAENVNSVFWIRDLAAEQVLYVSPAYEKIWGKPTGSLYLHPDSWLDTVHPDDIGWVREKLFFRKNREQGLEFRIIRPDGAIRWIRTKAFMVCDQTGKRYREVGIAEDITPYMSILDRLQESEFRYRTLFETSTDGISIYEISAAGVEQKIVDCNESYLKLAGRSKEELFACADIKSLKKNKQKIMSRETHNPSRCSFGGSRCVGLYSWLRPDGRENFIECRGKLILFNGAEFMHCMHRDVTQVKLAEEKIRHLSLRIIESAEEEQKRIAANLHDEFGVILLSLRQQVDFLQKKSISPEGGNASEFMKISELVDIIGAAIRGATNRLRPDLLDNLGFVPALEWGLHDFSGRYPAIQTAMKISGAQRKIPPEYEIALYRLVQESLTNIGKHAGASAVSVRLIFSYPSLIVIVADDGRGFEPGDPVAPSSGTHGGLGLRSMHERMLAIGGSLSVRSRLGVGTKIRAEVRWLDRGQEASSVSRINDNALVELYHEW